MGLCLLCITTHSEVSDVFFSFGGKNLFPGNTQKHGMTKRKLGISEHLDLLNYSFEIKFICVEIPVMKNKL